MSDRIKNTINVLLFLVIIIGFGLANIIDADDDISFSERRKLAQKPDFAMEKFLNGKLFAEYENYYLDQFVLRDRFRTLKAIGRFYLMRLKDNNDIYLVGDGVYKMEYPLNKGSVIRAAEKLNEIKEKYLNNMNVYYSIIPDKSYFVAEKNGYLCIDYIEMVDIMKDTVKGINYIDIFDNLDISDYYRTDLHWKQEKILDIADKLLLEMGIDGRASDLSYTTHKLSPFYGAFYGQSALPIKPDQLVYLTNDTIENALVYDYQAKTNGPVYSLDEFGGIDSYNIFLYGPKPLLTIENPTSKTERELYIFRDSFSSALAPLLIEYYSKITLIDLRYVPAASLEKYISFSEGADVLFIYGTSILNNSVLLR